jgi:hypothetical protein
MRKLLLIALAVVLVVALGAGAAVIGSEGHPASKATASIRDITVLDYYEDLPSWTDTTEGWTPILANTIKTPNQKDLFIDVSLECGLYTETLVKGKGGERDTAMADAGVMVKVLLYEQNGDGWILEGEALPGPVIFGRRTQTLSAVFGGIITDEDIVCDTTCETECWLVNETEIECETECTTVCTINYATVDEEELQLILQTMNANSFNFIVPDVTPGVHKVVVLAKIDLGGELTDAGKGKTEAKALIGNGSVTIELVRMIKSVTDETIIFQE